MLTRRLALAAAASAVLAGPAFAADYPWKPERPITIIVPWAAGGATDQVTRLAAAEIEAALGQKVVIVNQPGATGSIGTKNALEAPKDGYTLTAGAAQDLGTYKVTGMLGTELKDWHLFLTVANVPVFSVNANSPHKDLAALLAAMKARPNGVTIATAGVGSAGHAAMETLARAAGVTYRHVTYDGGNPAVVATVAGETDATSQLAGEQAEMIRGKRLRPLAALSDKPLELSGVGAIPPVTQTVASLKPPTNFFGIFVPKGVPQPVVATLEQVWRDKVMTSDKLKAYATERGALFAPSTGAQAEEAALPAVRANAWILFDTGKAKVSPETVGLPRG
ncbi:MAG TPA: tripartite tricarboxylate transporter substrate binding protein [Salinarimonas sp.]|nr:tripartite tricarboxylate transporter substrate binding protein [Salinarimonas sp.]